MRGDLRDMRKRAGKTLRQVASELGLSPPYISDIERGNRSIPEGRIEQIATVLGVDPKELAKLVWLNHPAYALGIAEGRKLERADVLHWIKTPPPLDLEALHDTIELGHHVSEVKP